MTLAKQRLQRALTQGGLVPLTPLNIPPKLQPLGQPPSARQTSPE